MKFKRTALAMLTLVTVMGGAACGGGGDGGDASAAADQAPTTTLVLDDDIPGMEAAVSGLIDYSHTPAQLASELAGTGNEDLVPIFTQLQGVVEGFKVEFEVVDPQIQGQKAVASVQITSNGEPFPDLYPVFFERTPSGWKVTRAGFCSIVIAGGLNCPEAATTTTG